MPRKIRQLKADLRRAGFVPQANRGKGSHGFWVHEETNVSVTVSGQDGRDARAYQEAEVRNAIASVRTEQEKQSGERGAS
jgi:predicted RNA binding protein YcfA (HicA-like mRNA interferase family)